MTRIVSSKDSQRVGAPRFRTVAQFQPGPNRMIGIERLRPVQSVRRIFARDPNASSGLIGTKFDQIAQAADELNKVPAPNPRIVRAPLGSARAASLALLGKSVQDRSANRRLRISKS